MYYEYYRARLPPLLIYDHYRRDRFPRKHLRQCNGARLEARRSGLESWLNSMLQQSKAQNPIWSSFLLAGRFPTPAPISSLSNATERSVATPCHELVQIRVDIPEGVKHGELLSVVMPVGKTITISIPWGVPTSGSLRLWHNQVEGTLGMQLIQKGRFACRYPSKYPRGCGHSPVGSKDSGISTNPGTGCDQSPVGSKESGMSSKPGIGGDPPPMGSTVSRTSSTTTKAGTVCDPSSVSLRLIALNPEWFAGA